MEQPSGALAAGYVNWNSWDSQEADNNVKKKVFSSLVEEGVSELGDPRLSLPCSTLEGRKRTNKVSG